MDLATTPKVQPPSPVIIDGNDDWTEVRKLLRKRNISITKAKVTGQATTIFLKILDDFRALTRFLDAGQRVSYTYTLNEEKKVHAVIRRLPLTTEMDDICRELKDQEVGLRREYPCFW